MIILMLLTSMTAFGQTKAKSNKSKKAKVHNIVFQLTSNDPEVHKGLIRQLNNVLELAPDANLEVVCHGPGIEMLMVDKCTVQPKITELTAKKVIFTACENTLKQKNIEKSAIIKESTFVPGGIIEIVTKQEQGWSYIKAGF